jgi:hypothetical protein
MNCATPGWYRPGHGIRNLHDQSRSGRPPEIDEVDAVVATLASDGRGSGEPGVFAEPPLADPAQV